VNEDRLQQVIGADLFSSAPNIDGLTQVLRFMEGHAQPLSTPQLRAIAYLNWLGMRDIHADYRNGHKGKHPYSDLVKWIVDSAVVHSDPGVYLRTIEAVIPQNLYPTVPAAPPVGDKKRRR
jgi:hypothetical protein